MSSYSDSLDRASAPSWRDLEPNDRIIGVVTDLDTFEGDYGEAAPVLTIQVTDPSSTEAGVFIPVGEERRVFGFGTVLRREIVKLEPQIGDTVGVKFIGVAERAKAGQHPAKLWKLRVFERGTYGQAVEQGRITALATPTAGDLSAVEAARVAAAAAELEAKAAAERVAAAQQAAQQAPTPPPPAPTTTDRNEALATAASAARAEPKSNFEAVVPGTEEF